jgi:K+-sensing histidine kinase KdpD
MNLIGNAIDALDVYNTQRTKEEIVANPSRIQIHTEMIEKKHGGEIQCHSVSGQGTEFVIRIPVVKEHSRKH